MDCRNSFYSYPSSGSQRGGHHQTAAAVEAVHQGSVAALADHPTAACSAPVDDTAAAARQNILISFYKKIPKYLT
jgi:hypothetical protein